MRRAGPPRLHVLAGVNGAGKSTIGGAVIRGYGGEYFNPDEAARLLRERAPALPVAEANSLAWQQGVRLLTRALDEGMDFNLETTLGGRTITGLLLEGARRGHELHVWYVGLATPELHLERVAARVRRGGHDIPAADIRRRFEHSRLNLIELLPRLTTLRVYDNSAAADPAAGQVPRPWLVLEMAGGRIVGPADLAPTPAWAKAIVAAALRL